MRLGQRMEQYTGLDRRLERMARFFIRRRSIGVVLQIVIAGVCIWAMLGLRLRDDPNAWPPRTDPYVHLNEQIMSSFGGGNSVSIEVLATDGTIFTKSHLNTIKAITDDLQLVPGVIPYAIRSISSLGANSYAFVIRGTPDEKMPVTPFRPEVLQSDEEVERVRSGVISRPLLNVFFVSKDAQAALILAGFRSEVK